MPRMSGALAGLQYFKIPDAESRAQTYADRKQQMQFDLIQAKQLSAFSDALRFV